MNEVVLCNFCLLEGLTDEAACKRLTKGAKNPKFIMDTLTSQDTKLLKSLVDHGLDVNAEFKGYLGESLVMEAARKGLKKTFQMLLNLEPKCRSDFLKSRRIH